MFGGKELCAFGLPAICSIISANETYKLRESEEDLSQFL
jgi:hypothetical protein